MLAAADVGILKLVKDLNLVFGQWDVQNSHELNGVHYTKLASFTYT